MHAIPDPNGVAEIPIDRLPCTYSWIQFYFALLYRVSVLSRGKGRPRSSDQVDFRHACYAGLADVFVTDDGGMFETLSEMVTVKKAEVLRPGDYTSKFGLAGA